MNKKPIKKIRKAIRNEIQQHLENEINSFSPLPLFQRVKVAVAIIFKRPVNIR